MRHLVAQGVASVICCTGTTAFPSKRWDGGKPEETGKHVLIDDTYPVAGRWLSGNHQFSQLTFCERQKLLSATSVSDSSV